MKKNVIISFLLATLLLLSSCSSDAVTINVFNWGDYIDPEVLRMFTNETGIKVNYSTYIDNEDAYQYDDDASYHDFYDLHSS